MGNVAKVNDTRWNARITQWRAWERGRSRGSPNTRWYDDIKRVAELKWIGTEKTENR